MTTNVRGLYCGETGLGTVSCGCVVRIAYPRRTNCIGFDFVPPRFKFSVAISNRGESWALRSCNFSSHLIHSICSSMYCIDNSQHPPTSDDHHHPHLFRLVSQAVSCIPSSTISAYLLKHNHLSRRTCRALPLHLLRGAPLGARR